MNFFLKNINQIQKNKKNIFFYIIITSNEFFLQENIKNILKLEKKKNFLNYIYITILKESDWIYFFQKYSIKNFFYNKTILIVTILEKNIHKKIQENFKKISKIFTIHIKIIFKFLKLNLIKNYTKIFEKYFSKKFFIIQNQDFSKIQFSLWKKKKIQKLQNHFDPKILISLLKKNILNFLKTLKILKDLQIIYPNKFITFKIFKKYKISNIPYTSSQWINAIILGKKQKSIFILNKLKTYNISCKYLVEIFTNFILTVLKIKEKEIFLYNYSKFFIFYLEIKFQDILNCTKKNTLQNIYSAIKLLKIIDFNLKINNLYNIWTYFQILSITLN
ncbi:hypothetical protein [Buchnera aphidicola]|uniref:hypothetical protein n=1 Tax=Buchnera aphidicola TaxID=9 RepID=UPI0031B722C8